MSPSVVYPLQPGKPPDPILTGDRRTITRSPISVISNPNFPSTRTSRQSIWKVIRARKRRVSTIGGRLCSLCLKSSKLTQRTVFSSPELRFILITAEWFQTHQQGRGSVAIHEMVISAVVWWTCSTLEIIYGYADHNVPFLIAIESRRDSRYSYWAKNKRQLGRRLL